MSGVSDSPFDKTLFADRASRMRLLRAITSQTYARTFSFQGHRFSSGEANSLRAATLNEADQSLFNAARAAVLRERQACAEIAGKHSPEAAAAILSRPAPAPWSAA